MVGLNITVKPAAARAGTLTGLLGNDNGQPGDDLTTSDGVTLTAPTAQTVHQQFANSWRITQAQSLFDYKPGQSTATFTNRSFPSTYVNGSNIPGAAAATQECQADGVTDQYLLADCVVDVTAVKSPAVVSHYAQTQVVQTVQSNLAQHLPPFSPPSTGGGPTPTPGTASPTPNLQGVTIDSGRVNSPAEEQVFTFTAQVGDILWFGQPGCDDGGLTFAVVDPSGQTLNAEEVSLGLPGCQIGRIAATTSGTYQLVANADKQRAGTYGVPIRFERHDVVSQTSYGQTISGSIPDTATHDVYQFTAQAGDSLHIFGSGCNIGPENSIIGLADATGKPVGPALGLHVQLGVHHPDGRYLRADRELLECGTVPVSVRDPEVGYDPASSFYVSKRRGSISLAPRFVRHNFCGLCNSLVVTPAAIARAMRSSSAARPRAIAWRASVYRTSAAVGAFVDVRRGAPRTYMSPSCSMVSGAHFCRSARASSQTDIASRAAA